MHTLKQVRYLIGGLLIVSFMLPPHFAAAPVTLQDPEATLQRILQGISQSEELRETRVKEYTRIQHYWASSSRFDETAEMVVRMHYDRAHGKTYVVLSRSGSQTVQSRVFEKLLHLEIASASALGRETTLFTTSHYRFRLMGRETVNGRNCYVLELDPLQADRLLFRGKAWIDTREHAVVRVEGRPNSSVSFWVGHPSVVQEFGKFGDFWFATKRDSVATSMLLGTCKLRIDYADYKVILQP